MSSTTGRRRARPALSRAHIVAAARARLEDGKPLSVRLLAGDLGSSSMALYYYIKSVADLEVALVDEWLAGCVLPDDSLPLEDWVVAMALDYRRRALAEPHVFELVLKRPVVSVPALAPIDALFAAVLRAGFAPPLAAALGQLLMEHITGSTVNAIATSDRRRSAQAVQPEDVPGWEAVYAELPNLVALSDHLLALQEDEEGRFVAGVRSLLRAAPELLT